MVYMYIYAFFMLIGLLLYIRKHTDQYIAQIIIGYYSLIAVISIVGAKIGVISTQDVRLWPYMLILFSFFTLIAPFGRRSFSPEKTDIKVTSFFIKFVLILVIFSNLYSIYKLAPQVWKLYVSNAWAANRLLVYAGENLGAVSSNRLINMIVNLGSYFLIPAIILYFYLLSEQEMPKIRKILIISILASSLVSAAINSSRGTLFNRVALIICIYIFFARKIDDKHKKQFTILMFSIGGLFVAYSLIVTMSRFNNRYYGVNPELDSIIEYYGMAPVVFSSKVAALKEFAHGKYAFDYLLGSNFSVSDIGGTWGSSFFTYLGWMYIDWGFIGVVIMTIIIGVFAHVLTTQKRYPMSVLYPIFFIVDFIIKGALVIGRNYIYQLIGFFLVEVFIIATEKVYIRIKVN